MFHDAEQRVDGKSGMKVLGSRYELWMSHIVDIVCHPSQVLDIAVRVCAALSR